MARNPLSLHHLNALDVDPVAFVEIAGRLGAPYVCLFTHAVEGADFPLVTAENEAAVLAQLQASGVAVDHVEFVGLAPQMAWPGVEAAFARSARLGARRMTVHCFDAEPDRALASFARVCRIAADNGMGVGLEWTAVNPAISSLAQARAFLARAAQPNAALVVDLLHLSRAGDTPADVAALPRDQIAHAQISDGPLERDLADYAQVELTGERLPPGAGELPTAAFVTALPPGVVVDVESPQRTAFLAGVSALERAARAVAGARAFLR